MHINQYPYPQTSTNLETEKGGFFGSRLKSFGRILELKLQLKLEDASRYGCTLEVAIRTTRRSYRVLDGPKSMAAYHTIGVSEVRMVENVVRIGAQREG